jgi:hypothetical protein
MLVRTTISSDCRRPGHHLQLDRELRSASHQLAHASYKQILSLYILEALPVPRFNESQHRFLVRAALLLSCNHIGYTALWQEQAGKHSIPHSDRPVLRARIDAVLAQAYGLDRDGYRHVLNAFSHRSDPDAASRCLDAFDTLQAKGIKHWLTSCL